MTRKLGLLAKQPAILTQDLINAKRMPVSCDFLSPPFTDVLSHSHRMNIIIAFAANVDSC